MTFLAWSYKYTHSSATPKPNMVQVHFSKISLSGTNFCFEDKSNLF